MSCHRANPHRTERLHQHQSALHHDQRLTPWRADGLHDTHIPVDVFQTGYGTHMNANVVIARLAIQSEDQSSLQEGIHSAPLS
jgi:fumarate hydratase class II